MSNPLRIPIALLIFLTSVLMIPLLVRLPYSIVINYNEGWNAYQAHRAMEWKNLYEPGDVLIQNNYPPLSFYLVGAVGRMVGDDLFAGRWVAILSFLFTAFNIFLASLHMTRTWPTSLFGAVFFMAYVAAYFEDYVGMNDPQMLAHALMTGSLVVLVRGDGLRHGWMAAGILMILAGMVKHNLVAFPLAATAFFTLRDRGLLLRWLVFCLFLVVLAGVLLFTLYGSSFCSGIFTSRDFSVPKVFEGLRDLGPPLLVPLAVWGLSLFCGGPTRDDILILLYVVFSAVTGFIFYGGQGVGVNALFDLLIGLALGVGVGLARLDGSLSGGTSCHRWATRAACVALILAVLPPLPDRVARWEDMRTRLTALETETLADVKYLEARPGPALCTTLELGYWSGKPFEYDPFNVWQAVQMGRMDEEAVFGRIRNHYYGVVQLESISHASPESFPTHLLQQVERYYVLDRRSVYGFFFIPRDFRNLPAG